jgi:hypothetical protein
MRLARASNPTKTLATITFRGKSKKDLARNVRAFSKRHNVAAGFFDATGFHPIRASKDYSEKRVKRAAAQRLTRRARRRRQAIS